MCDCKNIEVGSYENQVLMKPWWSGKVIFIDKCLSEEMKLLWDMKIRTSGCCCGHNKVEPMINVDESDHEKMIKLGYSFWVNEFGTVCYTPKTTEKQNYLFQGSENKH